MALDFSLLGQGPQFQNILASYQAGAEQQKATQTKNALAMYQSDPEGAINALNKVDPVMALKLRDDQRSQALVSQKKAVFQETDPTKRQALATQTGDPDVITTVSKLDAAQLAQTKAANEALGSVAYGLRTKVPYEQRKAQIAQIALQLAATGMKPEEIASFDPTDQNLDTVIAKAQSLHDQVEAAEKQREFDVNSADKKADNERADRLANNTISTSNARLGIEGANLAMRRAEFSRNGPGGSRPATAEEKAAYGISADVPASMGPGGLKVISGTGAALKPVPAAIQKAITGNKSSMTQIDQAIADIDSNPKALGFGNALAPDSVTQRLPGAAGSGGVGTRAGVANIGSLIIHDRSGAAVTASETPRLKPFIPSVTDTPEAAKTKLRKLKQVLENNNNEMDVVYGEGSGFRPMGGSQPSSGNAPAKKPPLSAFQK
jgi:hypothetical protein